MRIGILNEDNKLIFYYWVLTFFFSSFFVLEQLQGWNPNRTVILAPLGEEPVKLFIALLPMTMLGAMITVFGRIDPARFNNLFSTFFLKVSILFVILVCALFGLYEGRFNPILHIGITTIGFVLTLIIYLRVKDKPWATLYKVGVMFAPISISMILHSITNQIMNVDYVQNHPEYSNYILIGKPLVNILGENTALYYGYLLLAIAVAMALGWLAFLQKNKI